ncbi:hypothetical protein KFE25_013920 [Diacronema lutheri]|uniref:AAA domain-containing protein n=2 Tax=Diacronema lutheri TaxID=2081491 RepID=A0A8J6C8G6_DIALT|nr:hypothetical protein KFE25_013920 [Diacronema lutheri]
MDPSASEEAMLPPFVAPVLALCALLAAIVAFRRARSLRARKHDRLRVCTFANHKGGVGKTTSALFCAQRLARENGARNVLVIDCSIYGDLTRLLLGTSADFFSGPAEASLIAARHTCEDYAAALHAARVGLLARVGLGAAPPDVRAHVHQVRTTCAGAPSNLFLMTNRAQWLNGPNRPVVDARSPDDESGLGAATNDELSAVAQSLRASLATGEDEWLVLVDTDGGLLHGMTKLALCVADSIVVPTNADTADVRRLHVMLRFMRQLHAAGLSTGRIDLCFFNALKVKANEPSDKMASLGLPFSVADDVFDEMAKLAAVLAELHAEFPDLLPAVELEGPRADVRAGSFFAGVRHGGVTLQRVKDRPYDAQLSDAVEADFGRLCARIDQLASAKTLHFKTD